MGDCVGSSADVFESVAAEIIAAMILGSTVATESNMSSDNAARFVFFPLIVHAMDVLVSTAGISFVGLTKDSADADPMKALQRCVIEVVGWMLVVVSLAQSHMCSFVQWISCYAGPVRCRLLHYYTLAFES